MAMLDMAMLALAMRHSFITYVEIKKSFTAVSQWALIVC